MKTKQQLIEEHLNKPFEEGDKVLIKIDYVTQVTVSEGKGKNKKFLSKDIDAVYNGSGVIKAVSVAEGAAIVELSEHSKSLPSQLNKTYDKIVELDLKYLTHETYAIGANPFVETDWWRRIQFYQSDIEQILHRVGYDRRRNLFKNEIVGEIEIPECDFNPVVEKDGVEIPFQRDLVWTLEQKQLLLDSIYNNIEIGKIVIRKRNWKWVENRINKGIIEHTAFAQMVDGKQRVTTLLEFINNEFKDSYGNYFDDFSESAKRKFFGFRSVTYGELGENATDEDTLNTFLSINHTGVPMSKEHIEFVKSIK